MFHTIYLFRSIDKDEFEILHYALNPRPISSTTFECDILANKGIRIFLKKASYEKNIKHKDEIKSGAENEYCMYYEIALNINPERMFDELNYIDMVNGSDYPKIKKRFRKIMSVLKEVYKNASVSRRPFIYHNIENYLVHRIDYCVNLKIEDVKKYMKLIKRADIIDGFNQHLYEKLKGMPTAINSYYFVYKNVTINFYDKKAQMENDSYFSIRGVDIEDANGIIRFEVQCNIRKVYSLKNKFRISSHTLLQMCQDFIAQHIILYYYSKTIGDGDYYSFKKAKIIIEKNEKYKKKTKVKMIRLLNSVIKNGSVYSARKKWKDGEYEFKKLIHKLEKIGVNPVTIPANWHMEKMPNLISRIEQKFTLGYRKINVRHL